MLELKNIVKYFNKGTPSQTIAIDHLNLQIKPGDFVTVIGGNGAGKSTLLNIIAGSVEADSGLILLNDVDMSFVNEHKRAPYFGRVFQDPMSGTCADMSILENLTIAYGRGRPRTIFKWFMQRKDLDYFTQQVKSLDLGLENRLNEKVGLLSGGQRQAITLLMATMRQRPSERVIKRDYVRFCESDKAHAKEAVTLAFIEAKKERKDSISNIIYQKADKELIARTYKEAVKKSKELVSKTDYKLAIRQAKTDKKEAFTALKKKRLSKAGRQQELEKINQAYEKAISEFDLTKQILLLDEHTAALDPKTASKVLEISEKIVNENQLTTIMITHNMKDAIRYGNRLIMMSHGKVVVDISGEEKKKLTVKQLLDMFQVASKDDTMSDSAILG